jgi:hypothetical protein
METKPKLISEIEYFGSAQEKAWGYLKEQSPRPVPASELGLVVLGLETSVDRQSEIQCAYTVISRLRGIVPRGCIQTEGRGYVFVDAPGEGSLNKVRTVRKQAFLEAAEIVRIWSTYAPKPDIPSFRNSLWAVLREKAEE